MQEILRSPMVPVGSDGNSLALYGITGQGKPHPRFYGTFVRVLGHYVRDLGLMPLHTAVHKMTGGSAAAPVRRLCSSFDLGKEFEWPKLHRIAIVKFVTF